MEVILLQDVKDLGKAGDKKVLADGYARNYLLPKGLAVEATKERLKETEEKKQKAQRTREKETKAAEELRQQLDGKTIRISLKTGGSDKLFGAVTSKEIAALLQEQLKVKIDRKKIEVSEPIKHLGDYKIKIKLYLAIQAEVDLIVKAE